LGQVVFVPRGTFPALGWFRQMFHVERRKQYDDDFASSSASPFAQNLLDL
jgi:hypothetical protein